MDLVGRPERRAAAERLAAIRAEQMTGHMLLSEALRGGDIDEIRAVFDDDAPFPNVEDPYISVTLLVLALDQAPLETIRQLLELGADPSSDASDGFPPLYSAIIDPPRPDRRAVIELLLSHGADPNQRGINDFTVLHAAAQMGDHAVVESLLEAGADPAARTRIDDYETPAETAAACGHDHLAAFLDETVRASAGDPDDAAP